MLRIWVACRDIEGIEHVVEVSAETLYEAVARGLCALKGNSWVADIGERLTTVTVAVKEPEVHDRISLSEFQKWLAASGRTPKEINT